MKVYAAKTRELTTAQEQELLCLLDKDRRKRLDDIKRAEDRARSIFAGLLLRYAYLQEGYTKQDWEQVQITHGAHGKPQIEQFHYSLSHSGEWVVCAVHDRPVGADIQQKKELRSLAVAKRFFSEEEYEQLLTVREEERKDVFYQMWTAKESYCKLTGCGLTQGIAHCVVRADEQQIYDSISQSASAIRLYQEIDGYTVCICTEKMQQEAQQIEVVAL